ncbi:MAG: hypothetical protein HXO69_08410 [Rothia sp.]|uniref:hypothetical protein n=1 Tax=Rothia sp. (in: high G+C Gram-positive bacteria) TaxID=1885016 RepID=UPI001CB4ACD4|nr:hypothetical protein [Rothia sp. (in: high G+C Gram-positive bacteria)]MBF1681281.1 hypothetical protein [Rothia sp. (in: high G+C Gram-positive bacteria)]
MNAQNNTPQQRPAAAASSSAPTESDLWEAAFSSDDPTVVLTDEDLNAARRAHEKAREAASSAQSAAQSSQDATRPLSEAATATQPVVSPGATSQGAESGADLGEPATDNLSWLDKPAAPSADNVRGNASVAPATAPTAAASYEVPAPGNAHAAPSAPQSDPAADDHFVIPTPAGTAGAAGAEPVLTAATALSLQKSRYSRMQLLPGLLGWLITISLMDGGLWAIQSWLALTGQSESIEYSSVVSRLFSGASNAVPVAVALSVLIFFAYLVGGYAAGRMARFAGAKQGIAVWLWQIMALILGSLATFLAPQLFQNGVASLSLQKLIAGDFANGLLAVLLVLALSFLGAILGGLCGRLYHRRVDKYPSDQVAREDA